MEFADVGAHCSVKLCKQKDFLPFTCNACNKVYCLDHRSYAQHECTAVRDMRVAQCPYCEKSIHYAAGEDEATIFERHARTECSGTAPAAQKKPRCAAPKCKEKVSDTNSTTCPKCKQRVCFAHRFETDHACPGRPPVPANSSSNPFVRFATGLFGTSGGSSSPSSKTYGSGSVGSSSSASSSGARSNSSSNGSSSRSSSNSSSNPKTAARDALREAAAARAARNAAAAAGGGGAAAAPVAASAAAAAAPAATGEQYPCPHCSQRFSDPISVVAHVDAAHNGGSGSSGSAAPGLRRQGSNDSCIIN